MKKAIKGIRMNYLKKIYNLILFFSLFIKYRLSNYSDRQLIFQRQTELIKKFKATVMRHSPFYKRYYQDELSSCPIMDKAQHLSNFNAINTKELVLNTLMNAALTMEKTRRFTDKNEAFTVGLSSGTSGNRGLFVTSENERIKWAAAIAAKLLPKGLWRKHRIALFLRADNQLYQRLNTMVLSLRFFDLILPLNVLIAQYNQLRPTILVAPAQVLKLLAEHQEELNTRHLRKIISCAEVLYDEDKQYIKKRFGLPIHEIYQCTEGFLGATCEYGHLHLNEDIFLIEKEWLDKETGRFNPIITDLRRTTQPIIRYRLNDVLIIDDNPCPCGSALQKIKKIEGRCDDVLYFKDNSGTTRAVFPDFISRTIIISDATVTAFQVIQHKKDAITVYVNPLNDQVKIHIEQAILTLFHKLQLNIPHCVFAELHKPKQLMQKFRRIIREIPKENIS